MQIRQAGIALGTAVVCSIGCAPARFTVDSKRSLAACRHDVGPDALVVLVTDEQGVVLPGARVSIEGKGAPEITGHTDATGCVVLEGRTAVRRPFVRASLPGFRDSRGAVGIAADGLREARLTLRVVDESDCGLEVKALSEQ